MFGFVSRLFDTDDFPARWHCGLWTPEHGWLHILSDLAIFGAYLCIPAVLAYFVIQRKDIPFPRLFWLFAAFIVCCGITHLNEAIIFWNPFYRWAGVAKLATAVVSWATVFALVPTVPRALAFRSPEELEREVETRTRELDDFAYAASHDLKAPLRDVAHLAEWIREDIGETDNEDIARNLDRMRTRVNRMQRLLDDLLEYSRAGRDAAPAERLDVAVVIAEARTLCSVPEGFEVDVPTTGPVIRSPRAPLQQVLMNLIANAITHHDAANGRVWVSVQDRGTRIEISVSDDGPGIPEELQERAMRIFAQLQPQGESEGSGVGLAIVDKHVRNFGGEVSIDSRGRGTTVRFTWPKDTGHAEVGT